MSFDVSHRLATWGRPGAFLSNCQRLGHRRKQRKRLSAPDVQLRQENISAVTLFQAVEDVSDGADVVLEQERNSAATLFCAGKDVSVGVVVSDDVESARPPASALQICSRFGCAVRISVCTLPERGWGQHADASQLCIACVRQQALCKCNPDSGCAVRLSVCRRPERGWGQHADALQPCIACSASGANAGGDLNSPLRCV